MAARLGPPPEEEPAIDLNALVEPYLGLVALVLGGAVLVLLLVVLVLARRVSRLNRRLSGLTQGEEGRSLEGLLDAHIEKVFAVARELDELSARSAVLEATQRRAFQRMGLVRFNPFEDTGGNQSFTLALLDANGDGTVVSSLHARSGTRIYAKSITGGKSEAALSGEETEALRLALGAEVDRARRG